MSKNPNHSGTFYKDGEYFAWKIVLDGRSIVVKRKTNADRKKAVQAKLRELEEKGFLVASSEELTVGQFLDRWLEHYIKPNREKKTYTSYEGAVRLHLKPKLGKHKLGKLTALHIQEMSNKLKGEGLTRMSGYAVSVLSRALNSARKQGLIIRNPCEAVIMPAATPERNRVLTNDEAAAFLKELYRQEELKTRPGEFRYIYRDRHLIKFLLNTGLRISEALGLLRVALHVDDGYFEVLGQLEREPGGKWEIKPFTKTKKPRTVPLTDDARQALAEQAVMVAEDKRKAGKGYEDNGLVFATESGKPVSSRNVLRSIYRAIDELELDKTTNHDLRRSFGTHFAAMEPRMHIVAEVLGHNKLETTKKHYIWADTELKKSAVANLKIGNQPPKERKEEKA